ncbi:hypothetical protein BD779DRAFT_1501314 [Infundibulicybe gibba]|nr:hypothetical protein BD779DRAFT_1501314 [Infundibulicybe gibba]
MARCTRRGCGQDFTKDDGTRCVHHPGVPVFHEGLKSWSCCADVNKPVLDFDDFMKIQGCVQEDHHTSEALPVEAPKPTSTTNFRVAESNSGGETFSTSTGTSTPVVSGIIATPPPKQAIEEEDDLAAPVNPGVQCRRNGCGIRFVSDEVSRQGEGEGAVCIYHPSPPIFREGSKGYLCCKRRVLEFDEFLKIRGCRVGRHVFVPRPTPDVAVASETTSCRIDHYQTVDKVHVSVFARQVEKGRSQVHFGETKIVLDLFLPGEKRFSRTLDLFGPIDPTNSSFKITNTKVEIQLQKKDRRGWTVLEQTARDLGNISLTFGVGGRTGTVGGKEIILDEGNKARGLPK